MKKLILDYSKWRSGGSGGSYKIGKGNTSLLNDQGYMCCLGQFALQLGAEEKDVLNTLAPAGINKRIPELTDMSSEYCKENNAFSRRAIEINDHPSTTPEIKIEQLTELCKNHNFELEVINKP